MPIATNCPNCQAAFRLPDELAGRQVKCQRCAQVFQSPAAPLPEVVEEEIIVARLVAEAPALPAPPPVPKSAPPEREAPRSRRDPDRDERRPPRRGSAAARRGVDPWVIFGSIGGALLVVGAIVAMVMMSTHQPQRARPAFKAMPPMAQAPPMFDKGKGFFEPAKDKAWPDKGLPIKPQPPPGPQPDDNAKAIKIALTKGRFEGQFELTDEDPRHPQQGRAFKLFLIELEAGKTYVVESKPERFRPMTRVETASRQNVAFGVDQRSLQFTAAQGGGYRIIASGLDALGKFTLTVRDASLPEPVTPRALTQIEVPRPAALMQKLPVADSRLTNLPTRTLRIGSVGDVCCSADGRYLYVLDSAGLLRRIALPGLVEEQRINLPGPCVSLAMSSQGLVVGVGALQEAWVVDPASLEVKKRIAIPQLQRIIAAPASSRALAILAGERFTAVNPSGVALLDLIKGEILGIQRVATTHGAMSPDGRYYFAQGGVEALVRFRVESDRLVQEAIGPRIASNGQRINISPDSKFVCLPSGGGNGPGYTTYVYDVKNLQTAVFTINSGAYPRVVGFDPAGGFAYAQNHDQPLLVFDFQGNKKGSYGSRASGPPDEPQQFLALPQGRKVFLRFHEKLVYAEFDKDGKPASQLPAAKAQAVGESVKLAATVTPDDQVEIGNFTRSGKDMPIHLEAGVAYRIDCEGANFRPFVVLIDDDGKIHPAQPATMNKASLIYRAMAAGVHHVVVGGTTGNFGAFTLEVRKFTGEAPALLPKTAIKSLVMATKKEVSAKGAYNPKDGPKVYSFLPVPRIDYTVQVEAEGFAPHVKVTTLQGDVLREERAQTGLSSLSFVYRAEANTRFYIHVAASDKKPGSFKLTIKR